MKKIYFCLLLFSMANLSQAQNIRFKANVAATYPTMNATSTSGHITTLIPAPSGFVTYQQAVELKERFDTKPGLKLGGNLSIALSAKFSFETGLQIQLTRFKRITRIEMANTTPTPGTTPKPGTPIGSYYGYYETDSNGNVIFVDKQPNSSTDNNRTFNQPSDKVGNTNLAYVDIPVNLSYTAFNKRFTFKGGLIGSILAYAEQYKNNAYLSAGTNTGGVISPWNPGGGSVPVNGPTSSTLNYQEYKDKSRKGFNSLLFALNAGVTFRLNAHWGITADYAHYLNGVYTSDSGIAKKSKYKTGSVGLSYQF